MKNKESLKQRSNHNHHDTGFRSIELSDQVSKAKLVFNVNTTSTKIAKYENQKDAKYVCGKREPFMTRYNILSGAA